MFTHLYRQSISCILSTVLLSNMLYGVDLAVDSASAAHHQAGLDVTANGVPLVNIVTPNGAGLSHNKFSDFNVNPIGLILNNATGIVSTQLGGMVQGNANLGTTPARVILNEVTGTSRTYLRGYTEVAGHTADVIVANPNGITVNGGGFINTQRATLTTGTPDYTGGVYQGLKVRGGDILIEGTGMVADNIDRVDLYTKTLQLNAEIHAKRLDVITGENDISADGSTYFPTNGTGTQTYSIDSSALGGIYANAITLIATDAGVGVNLPEITYASDSLSLNADGHIVLGAAVSDKTVTSTSKSLTVNGLLRSGTDMDIKATDTLKVSSNGVILSGGDITIHDTGTVRNEAGRIEADNDLSIQAGAIENLSSMTPTKSNVTTSSTALNYWDDFRDWKTTTTSIDTINKTLYAPAYLLSGNDMLLDSAIHNRYSIIAADRDLYLSGSLNNEAALNAHDIIDISHYVEHWEKHGTFGGHAWYHNYSYYEHYDTITDHVYSTISAGRNILGNLATVNNADITTGSNYSSLGVASTSYNRNQTTGEITYTLPDGKNGEFTLAADPALPYVIETNRLFTDYNTFVSSDYMMSRLNLNMAADTKRLGDARYETQLVRDAVFRLTGERRLSGFGTDTQQYQALMDNAISVAGDLNLALGISLSASQLASLDRDIVWMEERLVAGRKVLVPVVYLASLKNQTLDRGGKIVAGGDVALAVAGELNNAGTIRAGGSLAAQSDSITNTAGSITSNGDMLLHATNDITNTSGQIRGNNVALVSDNGSITSQTDHKQLDLSNHANTTGHLDMVGERAGIWAQGNLVANADKNINLVGAETAAGGNVDLNAKNITLASLEQNSIQQNRKTIETIRQHGSEVKAGGNVLLNASNDISIKASAINGENIALQAANDVTIATAIKKDRTTTSNSIQEQLRQETSTLNANNALTVLAGKDIQLESTQMSGKNIAIDAGENIDITATKNRDYSDAWWSSKRSSGRDMSLKESVASTQIVGDTVTMNSGGTIKTEALKVAAQDSITLNAAEDITLGTKSFDTAELHQRMSKKRFGGGRASMDARSSTQLEESNLQAGGDIRINSNQNVNVIASEVSAANALNITATGDTNILAGQESSQSEQWSKKSGWFSGGGNVFSSKMDAKSNASITTKASTLDGKTVEITSGKDTRVVGSNIVGENDVALSSHKSTNIEAAREQYASQERHEKNGWGIYGSSGGLGLTLGQQTSSDTFKNDSTLQSQSRSMVGSINGNLALNAGESVTVKGSDLVAGKDMSIHAKQVTLQESEDASKSEETHRFRQSGLTLALTGAVVDAAKTADQMQKASKKTDNDRVKGLAALSTALSGAQAAMELAPLFSETAKGGDNMIGISLTAGSSQSKSESSSESKTHSGTNARAGGDVEIIATGDGSNSDITIQGSDVTGKNITIKADDAVNLQASKDTYANHGSNSSSSGGIGVAASVGASGGAAGITANASIGRGKSNGSGMVNNNAHITATDTLNITSGGDTTLKGAVAKADTIKADVGGNLAIESIQDTDKYKSSSYNVGGSVTVGASVSGGISLGMSKATSDYASVNEQSGLNAGDGGFQINVGKNTDLKGGTISSNQSAIDNGKNSLSTETLTTSDLNNHAEYKAYSMAVGIGAGSANGQSSAGLNGIGVGYDKGSASTMTKSAISSANVTITDDAKQQALTGKTAQETIESINTDTQNAHQKVDKIFNASKVEGEVGATAQIMQRFTSFAPKAVADYSSAKASELRSQGNEAEAQKWDEGGIYRVAAHTIAGGLVGGVGGAIGSATASSSAPLLESFQNATTQALINAGMSADSAASIASGLASITATGMGALAGSTTGEAGTLNGAATAYGTDANNRQLHNQEIRWIKNHAKEYAKKTGLTPEQAEALLTNAAMYYVDEKSAKDSGAISTNQKDTGFLSLNPYDQSQYAQAYNYMRANSKGEYFTDAWDEKMNPQRFFTATKAQYADNSYNPNQSQGLSDQSFIMLPAGKATSGASKLKADTIEGWGTGPLREPAQALKKNEDILIDATHGLQSRQPNSGPFQNTILGTHGDAKTTYLYTVDERGINLVLEKTPFPTPRGNVVHSNISSKASIGGEAWFGPNNTVTINAGSGRFGDRAGITVEQWNATAKLWQSLGYKVNQIPFMKR